MGTEMRKNVPTRDRHNAASKSDALPRVSLKLSVLGAARRVLQPGGNLGHSGAVVRG